MVLPSDVQESGTLVYGHKLSSVGPGRSSGSDLVHNPEAMDLAMKLHYLRGVYFFSSQAIEELPNMKMKETMFYWLNEYFHTCGRFRRSDSGRPFVKCNDCGARFIEAHCDKTIVEWLEMGDWPSLQKLLVSQQVIGPELPFSPPLLFQVTHFRCGGISLGLSWAHVLGDAFSAADFMNKWAEVVADFQSNGPPKPTKLPLPGPKLEDFESPTLLTKDLPLSLNRVDPVGDHWIATNNTKMETFSFPVSPSQIAGLKIKILGPFFDSLCAIIWQSIAKLRKENEPKTVTICRHNPKRTKGVLTNSQIISTVKADFSIVEADPKRLVTLLADQATEETTKIEEAIEKDQGVSDVIVYGANLTFVDWQEADFYGFELQGHKPDFVSYSIQGIGDNGAVLVLPGSNYFGKGWEKGRLVTVILPENEVSVLKSELKKNDLLLESSIEW